MKIYTVVGEADYEGISELGMSFANEDEANKLKDKCEAYDKTQWNGDDHGNWMDKHPFRPVGIRCCGHDSYNVIEHELIGGDE